MFNFALFLLNEADNLHMCVNDDVDDLMGNKLDIMSDEKGVLIAYFDLNVEVFVGYSYTMGNLECVFIFCSVLTFLPQNQMNFASIL